MLYAWFCNYNRNDESFAAVVNGDDDDDDYDVDDDGNNNNDDDIRNSNAGDDNKDVGIKSHFLVAVFLFFFLF